MDLKHPLVSILPGRGRLLIIPKLTPPPHTPPPRALHPPLVAVHNPELMSAAHPRPIRDDAETSEQYIARVIEWQAGINNDHVATTFPPKVCGSCSHHNGAAAKKCSECGHNLGLSMSDDAVKSRKRRLDEATAKAARAHTKCLICLNPLARGGKALGISLCVQRETDDDGQTRSRVVPCGRQMHLKCLKKQLKASKKRNGQFGLQPNKCANCQMKTKKPHYVQIYGP